MGLFDKITAKNLLHKNIMIQCEDIELNEDFSRFRYLKRLLHRYRKW